MCLDDAQKAGLEMSLAVPPAAPDDPAIAAMVDELYGLRSEVTRVSGEQDLNYRVVPEFGGDLMLKFVNRSEPSDVTDFQTSLLRWLSRDIDATGPMVPRVLPTISGNDDGVVPRGSLAGMRTRLTSWLPGVSPRSFEADQVPFKAIGRTLAQLHLSLARFPGRVPALDVAFDLRRAELAVTAAAALCGWAIREQVVDVLTTFIEDDLPKLNSLDCQLIHHDFNQDNLLLTRDGRDVVGTFDFGDTVLAPRILDVAVSAAYFFDPVAASGQIGAVHEVVSGYMQVQLLTDAELQLVPRLMRARYALALTLTRTRANQASDDPRYATYLLRNENISTARMNALTDDSSKVLAAQLCALSGMAGRPWPHRNAE